MNFVKQIERLQLLNRLIKEGKTGTPDELSRRLGISKRQLFNLIDSLKNLGVDLGYNKRTKTYYYAGRSKIDIQFSLVRLTEGESEKIYGGHAYKMDKCNFISLSQNTLEPGLNRFLS